MIKKRQIQIPLVRALEQAANPALAAQGAFITLENFFFDKTGMLARRHGYNEFAERTGTTIALGDSTSVFRLAKRGKHLFRIEDSVQRTDVAYGGHGCVYTLADGDWVKHGYISAVNEIIETPCGGESTGECGAATHDVNEFTLVAWLKNGVVYYRILEASTRALVEASNYIAANAVMLRVFRWKDELCFGWVNSSTYVLYIRRWDVTTQTWALTTFSSTTVDIQCNWDCTWNSGDYLHVIAYTAYYAPAPSVFTLSTAGTWVAHGTATTCSSPIFVALAIYSGRVIMVAAAAAVTYAQAKDELTFNQASGVITVNATKSFNSAAIIPRANYAGYYEIFCSYITAGNVRLTITRLYSFQDHLAGGGAVAFVDDIAGLRLVSKAFAVESSGYGAYFWAIFDETDYTSPWTTASLAWDGTPTGQQRQLVLVHRRPTLDSSLAAFGIAGRMAYRTAFGRLAIDQTHEVRVNSFGWEFAHAVVTSGDVRLRGNLKNSLYSVNFENLEKLTTFGSDKVYLSGGIVQAVSSQDRYHVGSISAPDQIFLSDIGAGADNLPAGTYQYKAVYKYTNSFGEILRSAPSLAVQITLAAPSRVSIAIPPPICMKETISGGDFPQIECEIYRTMNSGELFYLLTNLTAYNMYASISALVYTDFALDTDLREILYSESGEAFNDMPPTCSACIEHDRRLWVSSGNRLYYSKWHREGHQARFVETWYLQFTEQITALASQDQALIAFTANAIWVVQGAGPDDLGSGEFNSPAKLPGNMGCSKAYGGQKSICTLEIGTLFRADKGVAILPRGLAEPVIISGPVEDTLILYERFLAVVDMPYLQQVKFILEDCSTIFIWAYSGGVPGLWLTETGTPHTVHIRDGLVWDKSPEQLGFLFATAPLGAQEPGILWLESFDYVDDATGTPASVVATFETAEIRPFGLSGDGRVYSSVFEIAGDSGDIKENTTDFDSWGVSACTVAASAETDPDGGTNAFDMTTTAVLAESYLLLAATLGSYESKFEFYFLGDTGFMWVQLGAVYVRIDLENGTTVHSGNIQSQISYLEDGWRKCTVVLASGTGLLYIYLSDTTTKASAVPVTVTLYSPWLYMPQLVIQAKTDGASSYDFQHLRLYDVSSHEGPYIYENPVQVCTSIQYRVEDRVFNAYSNAKLDYSAIDLNVGTRGSRKGGPGKRA
jgi:hypothetical protein